MARTKKKKTARQVRFLFSSGSPLTKPEKAKLATEIRTKKVRITKKKGGKRVRTQRKT